MLRLGGLQSAGGSGTATAATIRVIAALILVVGGTGAVRSQLQQPEPEPEPARPMSDVGAAVQVVGPGPVMSVDELVSDAGTPVAFAPHDAVAGEGGGFVAAVSEVLRSGVSALRSGVTGVTDRVTEPLRGTPPAAESAEDRASGAVPPLPDEQRAGTDRHHSPALAPIVPPEVSEAEEAADISPAPTPAPTPLPHARASAPAPRAPSPPQPSGPQFFIRGAVSGLLPGSSGLLELTITNPHEFDIDVVTLAVEPAPAPSGCTTRNGTHPIQAGRRSLSDPPIFVPAGGTSTVQLLIQMAHDAADGCQGKRFPLHYDGRATRR